MCFCLHFYLEHFSYWTAAVYSLKLANQLHFKEYASMSSKRRIAGQVGQSSVSGSKSASTPSTILYDLNIFNEWGQDLENVVSSYIIAIFVCIMYHYIYFMYYFYLFMIIKIIIIVIIYLLVM